MAKQVINTGAAPNDGTGDTLRSSFTKTNSNFTELYNSANTSNSQIVTLTTFTNSVSEKANGASYAANAGMRQINSYFPNATIYPDEENSIIVCDPGSFNSNVIVVLPDDAYNGKIYTIKNINTAAYFVQITSNTLESIEVFNSLGTYANSSFLNVNGQFVTYVFDNGKYRIIG